MQLGIDLGTTFCCAAFINDGIPEVIINTEGKKSTPSVIWFDGAKAFVGDKANQRKISINDPIFEFVKRDIGNPTEVLPGENISEYQTIAPYEFKGYKYGASGMSAIMLRKIKRDALKYLQNKGILRQDFDEKEFNPPCVITVPASFRDIQRKETHLAGYAAGLNVVGIINEPTAAALTYGLGLKHRAKILVFDLGGGTLDVTILETQNNDAVVLSSEGADQLGGKDWDSLIEDYLRFEYQRQTGFEFPENEQYYLQRLSLEAKFALTDHKKTDVNIEVNGHSISVTLHRNAPQNSNYNDLDISETNEFYFNEKSSNLLMVCENICNRALECAGISWGDLDEIVMAGSSCRMPMIGEMLEKISGRKLKKPHPDFDLETAIAKGAAIYCVRKEAIQDVTSKTVGIKVQVGNDFRIEHLIPKNKPLPAQVEKSYRAGSNAVLEVYEGESSIPDECTFRGRLELNNAPGYVKVNMLANIDGILSAVADYPPQGQQKLELKNDLFSHKDKANILKEKVQAIEFI